MGIEIIELSDEKCVARMPVAGNRQPMGLLHGGANVMLAETIGSLAAALHGGAGRYPVGIEVSATHHRAVTDGYVTAVAVPLSLRKNLTTHEIVISDDKGHRTCTARLTCMLRDHPAK